MRRNSPLHIEWINNANTVLTFALHRSDVVAVGDDGSLRRWRRSGRRWLEISRTRSQVAPQSHRTGEVVAFATTQLGYNDAITISENSIYFGVGKSLQALARLNNIYYKLMC
jgi:hypothetical protein